MLPVTMSPFIQVNDEIINRDHIIWVQYQKEPASILVTLAHGAAARTFKGETARELWEFFCHEPKAAIVVARR